MIGKYEFKVDFGNSEKRRRISPTAKWLCWHTPPQAMNFSWSGKGSRSPSQSYQRLQNLQGCKGQTFFSSQPTKISDNESTTTQQIQVERMNFPTKIPSISKSTNSHTTRNIRRCRLRNYLNPDDTPQVRTQSPNTDILVETNCTFAKPDQQETAQSEKRDLLPEKSTN